MRKTLIERAGDARAVSFLAEVPDPDPAAVEGSKVPNRISNSFVLTGYSAGSFQMPDDFDGSEVTVQVTNVELIENGLLSGGPDPSTFVDLVDYDANAAGDAYPAIAVGAGEARHLWERAFSFRWARLVSDVDQTVDTKVLVNLVS